MARPESWLKNYEDIEFDLTFPTGERAPMLPPKSHLKGESSPPSPVQWSSGAMMSRESSAGAVQGPSPPTTTTTRTATVSTGSAGAAPSKSTVRPAKRASDPFTSIPASPSSSSPSPPPTLAPPGSTGPVARIPRSYSSPKSFPPSPLNPLHAAPPPTSSGLIPSPFSRPGERGSAYFRIASEEARALGAGAASATTTTGSMILYRVADRAAVAADPFATVSSTTRDTPTPSRTVASDDGLLPPPPNISHRHRDSVYSTSGDSIVSLSSDSKYPLPASASQTLAQGSVFIAYAYDPAQDDESLDDDEIDWLHDPETAIAAKLASSGKMKAPPTATTPGKAGPPPPPVYFKPPSESSFLSYRGFLNVTMLILLIVACLSLFIAYPTVATIRDDGVNKMIAFNTRINSTGQAVDTDFDPAPGTNTTTTTTTDGFDSGLPTSTTTSTTSTTSTTTTSTTTTRIRATATTTTTSTDLGTSTADDPTATQRRRNLIVENFKRRAFWEREEEDVVVMERRQGLGGASAPKP